MQYIIFRRIACWLMLLLAGWLARPLATRAQAPAWQTAANVSNSASSTTNASYVSKSVADGNGNVYLTGAFYGTLKLGTTTLVSRSYDDIFVAKYNVASGQYVWVVQGGGAGNKEPQAIAFSGNAVYISGLFLGTAAGFGSTTLTGASSATNVYDIFITKLTDAGTSASFTWAVRAGGSGRDTGNAIAASGGSVYVAGDFDSAQATFGSTVLTLAGGEDSFLAKLTDAGSSASFAWVKQWGGAGVDDAFGLALSGSALYVSGLFAGTCPFGSTTLTSAGGNDGYVAKLVDAGSSASFGWVQQVGGPGNEVVNTLASSGSTVYVAGSFASASLAVGGTTLTNVGGDDLLVAKLVDAGSASSLAWALRGGGPSGDTGYALDISGNNVYVAGIFNGSSAGTLGSATFGTTTLQAAGGADALLLKLADNGSTGSFVWAQQAGSGDDDYAQALSVAGNAVVVAGVYLGASMTLGPFTLANPTGGNGYGFVATTSTTTLATQAAQPLPAEALYPNPAHGSVTVQVPAAAGPATLRLHDALGRVVRTAATPASRPYLLDLGGLAPGLYVVQVQAGNALATRQLVVE